MSLSEIFFMKHWINKVLLVEQGGDYLFLDDFSYYILWKMTFQRWSLSPLRWGTFLDLFCIITRRAVPVILVFILHVIFTENEPLDRCGCRSRNERMPEWINRSVNRLPNNSVKRWEFSRSFIQTYAFTGKPVSCQMRTLCKVSICYKLSFSPKTYWKRKR